MTTTLPRKIKPHDLKALRHRRYRLIYWMGDKRTSPARYAKMREELRSPKLDLGPDETCNTCAGNYYGHGWITDSQGTSWMVADIIEYKCRFCRRNENHGLQAGPHPSETN